MKTGRGCMRSYYVVGLDRFRLRLRRIVEFERPDQTGLLNTTLHTCTSCSPQASRVALIAWKRVVWPFAASGYAARKRALSDWYLCEQEWVQHSEWTDAMTMNHEWALTCWGTRGWWQNIGDILQRRAGSFCPKSTWEASLWVWYEHQDQHPSMISTYVMW